MTTKKRWERVEPGHYELRKPGCTAFFATVERSTARPWAWWWHVWGTSASGIAFSLREAKSAALEVMQWRNP